MKNKLHILVSVCKIYDNANDYVAIVTSYSARMLYLGPTRDMYSEIWSARLSTGKDISIRGASTDGPAYKIHLPMMIADFLGMTDVVILYIRRLLS